MSDKPVRTTIRQLAEQFADKWNTDKSSINFHAAVSNSVVKFSTKKLPANGSTVSVTPLSLAIICCVRKAVRAAFSVGNDNASSKPLVCKDCVPPYFLRSG